jgi:hypothetical protein
MTPSPDTRQAIARDLIAAVTDRTRLSHNVLRRAVARLGVSTAVESPATPRRRVGGEHHTTDAAAT